MKGNLKTRIVSALLILFIITDMFSPYSILLNKSYAYMGTDVLGTKPAVVVKTDGNLIEDENNVGDPIKYFEVELAMVADESAPDAAYIPQAMHLDMKYDSSKIAILDTSLKKYDVNGSPVTAAKQVKKYLGLSTDLTFQNEATNLNSLEKGSISLDMENGDGYGPTDDYEGNMVICTMKFQVLDESIVSGKIPADVIQLLPNESVDTGIQFYYYNDYDDFTAGGNQTKYEIKSADYFGHVGFVKETTNVPEKKITSVKVKENTLTKTEYEHGDKIDVTGGMLEITYDSGETETVSMENNADLKISKETVSVKDGETQTISATYKDVNVTGFNVTVKDPIYSITVKQNPSKSDGYKQGELLDLSGIELEIRRKSQKDDVTGTIEKLQANSTQDQQAQFVADLKTKYGIEVSDRKADIKSALSTSYENTANGLPRAKQKVTFTLGEISAFTEFLVEDTVLSIEVTGLKETYLYGEKFNSDDKANIIVHTTGGANLQNKLSSVQYTVERERTDDDGREPTYQPNLIGEQKLTIKYLGKSTNQFTVTVKDYYTEVRVKDFTVTSFNPKATAQDIVAANPQAKVYVLTASGKEELQQNLTADMIEGLNSGVIGKTSITIKHPKCNEEPAIEKETIEITIKNTVTKIKVEGIESIYEYGDQLDLSKIKITPIYYNNDEGTKVTAKNENITKNLDSSTLGKQKVEITYEGIKAEVEVEVKDKVKEIKVNNPKTEYRYGDQLDKTIGEVEVYWMSGAVNTKVKLDDPAVTITEKDGKTFNSLVEFAQGTTKLDKELTVTYKGTKTSASKDYKVTINNRIQSIAVTTDPTKKVYNVNEALTTAVEDSKTVVPGAMLTITRQNGAKEEMKLESKWVVWGEGTTIVTKAPGDNIPVTVKYTEEKDLNEQDPTTTFNIKVENSVKAVKLLSQPTRTVYGYGDSIELGAGKGAQIEVTYGDNTTKTIDVTTDMLADSYDPHKLDVEQHLKVKYGDIVTTETINVKVVNKIKSMEIVAADTTYKYDYEATQKTEAKLKVKVTYRDGKTEDVTYKADGLTITGFDLTKTGEKTVEVVYTQKYEDNLSETLRLNYNIKVIDEVTGIEITKTPKTEYKHGELFETTGGEIKITRKSGKTETVGFDKCNVDSTSFKSTEIGTHKINVTYKEEGVSQESVSFTKEYNVEVKNYITGIEVTTKPKTNYQYAEPINLAGGIVTVTWKDPDHETATPKTINLSDEKITIENKDTLTNTLGENIEVVVKLTEEPTISTKFYISVIDEIYEVKSNNITVKVDYKVGEKFSSDGYYEVITKQQHQNNLPGTQVKIDPEKVIDVEKNIKMLEGFDTSTPTDSGARKMKVTLPVKKENGEYYTFEYSYNVNDYEKSIELVYDGEFQTKYDYSKENLGNINTQGLTINVVMASGNKVPITVESNKIKITTGTENGKYTANKLGAQVVTVTYNNNGVELKQQFTITVIDKLVSIQILNAEKIQKDYFYGDEFNPGEAQIELTKLTGNETINLTKEYLSNFYTKQDNEHSATDALTEKRTATVSYSWAYENEEPITATATFDYSVKDYIASLKLEAPEEIKYYYGDEESKFDANIATGKLVGKTASGKDITPIVLDKPMLSAHNLSKLGKQEITVSYQNEKGETIVIEDGKFDITVYDKITSIELVNGDKIKKDYLYGDKFAANGATLTIKKLSQANPITGIAVTEDMLDNFFTSSNENPANAITENRKATIKYTPKESEYVDVMPEADEKLDFNYSVKDYLKDVVLTAPSKTEYEYNEPLDLKDAYLTPIKASGITATEADRIPLTNENVTISYDKKPGGQKVTVTYKDPVTGTVIGPKEFSIVIKDAIIGVNKWNLEPLKQEYKVKDHVNLKGANVVLNHANGTTSTVNIESNMVNPNVLNKPGESVKITVTVEGYSETVTVKVTDWVEKVEISKMPEQNYIAGEKLDLSKGKIKVTMASGEEKEVALTDSKVKVTGFDTTKEGSQTLKVTYDNLTGNGLNPQFVVNVVDKLSEIAVTKLPTNQQYYGNKLDLTGAVLTVTNTSGSKETIDLSKENENVKVTGYNPNKLGEQTITVEYTNEKNETEKVQFKVIVEDHFVGTKFTAPVKTSYKYGEELDLKGGKFEKISASGKNNEVIELTKDMVTGFDNTKEGTQTLTVKFEDKVEKYNITLEDKIVGINVNRPSKTEYNVGEALSIADGTITVIKESGRQEVVNIAESIVSGYDANKVGSQVITVTYANKTATFEVVVNAQSTPVKPSKPTKPSKPAGNNNSSTNTESNETSTESGSLIDDILGGMLTDKTNDEDTNANASENKDKEHNNDVDKDITLAGKDDNGEILDNENGSVVVKTATVAGLGIVALIALVFIAKRGANVRIYEEDENELILVGKERLTEDSKEIDLTEYVQKAPDKNIIVVLNKNIAKKLDKQRLVIKLADEELETVVDYEDGEFEIRIEK